MAEMANAERQLSCALLSLISPAEPASNVNGNDEYDEQHERDNPNGFGIYHQHDSLKTKKGVGLVNSSGAWCWREDCQGKFHGLIIIRIQLCYPPILLRVSDIDQEYAKNGRIFARSINIARQPCECKSAL